MKSHLQAIFRYAVALSWAAPFMAWAVNPPAAVTPYTFLGRLMDSTHKAFDDNRSARISVRSAAGDLLAEGKTFHRADSRRNYSLAVPMSSTDADGYVVQNASVVDDLGKVWRGVVVDAAAGAPGAIREIDIVLGEDKNGDGIDDALFAELKAQWEASDYWAPGETFDPKKDYDGDGVSTIAEALSGTDPFNPSDALRITAFSRDAKGGAKSTDSSAPSKVAITFNAVDGRAYSVVEAGRLDAKDWKPVPISLSPDGEPMNVISRPSGNGGSAACTVYLLPSSKTNAFFRVKSE